MKKAAELLQFELAAQIRDEIRKNAGRISVIIGVDINMNKKI